MGWYGSAGASSAEDLYLSICRQRNHRFPTCSALHHDFSLLLQAGGDCFQNQTEESAAGSKQLAEPQQVRPAPACLEMITDADAHSNICSFCCSKLWLFFEHEVKDREKCHTTQANELSVLNKATQRQICGLLMTKKEEVERNTKLEGQICNHSPSNLCGS